MARKRVCYESYNMSHMVYLPWASCICLCLAAHYPHESNPSPLFHYYLWDRLADFSVPKIFHRKIRFFFQKIHPHTAIGKKGRESVHVIFVQNYGAYHKPLKCYNSYIMISSFWSSWKVNTAKFSYFHAKLRLRSSRESCVRIMVSRAAGTENLYRVDCSLSLMALMSMY